jgi:4-hydroxythreonine-4-phosphate dehydrogenase
MTQPHVTQPPVIAVSCGDPAGIGPEIALRARQILGQDLPFAWIGDARHLPQDARFEKIKHPQDARHVAGDTVPVLHIDFDGPATAGQPNPAHAEGVISAIKQGVDWVTSGAAAALCTGPINKKALYEGAGFAFAGHTEYLAHLAGDCDVVMMLAAPELRVVPVTIHIPITRVAETLTPALLKQSLRITQRALQADFGIASPRLAVAGLNPHAGEGGAMGGEEIALIIPVLDDLRREGMNIIGPLSADTMFHARARATYDVAICMYHDQALIPIKTIDFDGGVNVTLGLPFIRTSPDHGTAYDIAGRGIARPDSFVAALRMAQSMARSRGQHGHD